jgi:ppGpp synthetase/RelA/SpoT-type nucleotidyltranferase
VSDADWALLERVLDAYQEALDSAQAVLEAAGHRPTSLVKSTSTLVDKLRRVTSFKSLQDVAGLRIVLGDGGGRMEQDRVVAGVQAAFAAVGSPTRVIDRRSAPSHGYRAVHVIVTHDGLPVEVQIRTPLQDLWAQILERLGDAWGRGLRYGEPLEHPDKRVVDGFDGLTRADLVTLVQRVGEMIDDLESSQAERELTSKRALGPGAEITISPALAQLEQQETSLRTTLDTIGRLVDVVEREAR